MTALHNTQSEVPETSQAEVIASEGGLVPWSRTRREGWVFLKDRFALGPPEFGSPVHPRIRAPHENRAGFHLAIHRQGSPVRSGELSVGPEVTSGDPAFDRVFRVESNDEGPCRTLLAEPGWRDRLLGLPILSMDIGVVADPAGARLPAGVDELRLLLAERANLVLGALPGLIEFSVETLNRLCQMGVIAPPVIDHLPDRYSRPRDQMVLETIDLDAQGTNCLIFDVEALVHDTNETFHVPLPPRIAALRILRNRPIPYDTIRSVRTLRAPRHWLFPLGIAGMFLGLVLIATQRNQPVLLAIGVVLLVFLGVVPLVRYRLRPAFLLIASEKTAIAIPLKRARKKVERIVSLLREATARERVSWDL